MAAAHRAAGSGAWLRTCEWPGRSDTCSTSAPARQSVAGVSAEGLFGALAGEVRRVVDAARAFVAGDLGPGAQRARADGLPVHDARGSDRGRRFARFHPMHEGRDAIEGARPNATTAMEHAGDHEQAREFGRRRAHLCHYVLVVFEAHAGIELRVGPSEVHEQLAAALTEGGEIGIGGVENLASEGKVVIVLVDVKLLHRVGFSKAGQRRAGTEDESNEAAGVAVPGALAGRCIDVLADPGALAVGSRGFGTHGPAREVALALAGHVAVKTLQSRDLIRREAIGAIGRAVATGKVAGGAEVAAQRVVDETVFEAVFRIAFFIDASGKEF